MILDIGSFIIGPVLSASRYQLVLRSVNLSTYGVRAFGFPKCHRRLVINSFCGRFDEQYYDRKQRKVMR